MFTKGREFWIILLSLTTSLSFFSLPLSFLIFGFHSLALHRYIPPSLLTLTPLSFPLSDSTLFPLSSLQLSFSRLQFCKIETSSPFTSFSFSLSCVTTLLSLPPFSPLQFSIPLCLCLLPSLKSFFTH